MFLGRLVDWSKMICHVGNITKVLSWAWTHFCRKNVFTLSVHLAHIYVNIHICGYVQTCMYTYTYTYISAHTEREREREKEIMLFIGKPKGRSKMISNVCIYTYIYVCIHVYVYIYMCICLSLETL